MGEFEAFHVAFFAIIITRQDGVITFVNTAANQMLGYSDDELVGQKVEVLIPESLRQGHVKRRDEYVKKPLNRLMNQANHFTVLRKDGSEFPAFIGLSPISIKGEKVISVAIHDVTDIEERANKDAHEKKIKQVGKKAMEIAHNFNNCISGIYGQSYLLKKSIHDERDIKRLNVIDSLCDQSAEMIKELMAYGRLESQLFEKINLISIFGEVEEIVIPSLNSNIHLQLTHDSKPVYVFGAKSQLEQIILNIINNAVYAIGKNQGEIIISCRRCVDDCERKDCKVKKGSSNTVCVEISDTGAGISQENMKKIFTPFFTTKPAGEGTGLGLSSIASIIKNHGGELSVSSQEGEGTSFQFYLPSAVN